MNKNLFRRVFSKHQGMLVAVAEHVKGHGKRAGESRAPALTAERGIISTLTAIALALLSFDAIEAKAQGLPTGRQVAAGQATISQPNGSTMNINQASQRAVLDWNTFNIGQGNTVQFQQPNAQAQALNRVTGAGASSIHGSLLANGQVLIQNANGVLFGKNAVVNVGSLLATTKSIDANAFMNGDPLLLKATGIQAGVINEGNIQAQGYVTLMGDQVRNSGTIATAPGGQVVLAAGDSATVALPNGQGISLVLDGATANALVENAGHILSQDGSVLITARGKDALLNTVVNLDGVVRAGTIVADAGATGDVVVTGQLDASNLNAGGQGGTVVLSGDRVGLFGDASIDVSGDAAGGTAILGGDSLGMLPGTAAEGLLQDGMTFARHTQVDHGARIQANAVRGDGGFVETSGEYLDVQGTVSAASAQGKAGHWLIDPTNITISTGMDVDYDGSVTEGFLATRDAATVNNATISDALNAGTDVTITTASSGAATGNIVQNAGADITKTSGAAANLTMIADANITLNGNITSTSDKLNLNLTASAGETKGAVTQASTSTIDLNGGQVQISGDRTGTSGRAVDMVGNLLNIGGGDIRGTATGSDGVRLGALTVVGDGTLNISGSVNNTNGANLLGVRLVGKVDVVDNATLNIMGQGVSGAGIQYVPSGIWVTDNGRLNMAGTSEKGSGIWASGRIEVAGQGSATVSGNSQSGAGIAIGGINVRDSGSALLEGVSATGVGFSAGTSGVKDTGRLQVKGTSGSSTGIGGTFHLSGDASMVAVGTSQTNRGANIRLNLTDNASADITGSSVSGDGFMPMGTGNQTISGNATANITGSSVSGNGVTFDEALIVTDQGTLNLTGTSTEGSGVWFERYETKNTPLGIEAGDASHVTISGTSAQGSGVGFKGNIDAVVDESASLTVIGSSTDGTGIDQNGTLSISGEGTVDLTGKSTNGAGIYQHEDASLDASGLGALDISGESEYGTGIDQGGKIRVTDDASGTVGGTSTHGTGLAQSETGAIDVSGGGMLDVSGKSTEGTGVDQGGSIRIADGGAVSVEGESTSGAGVAQTGNGSIDVGGTGSLDVSGKSVDGTGVDQGGVIRVTEGGGASLAGESASGTGVAQTGNGAIDVGGTGSLDVSGKSTAGTGVDQGGAIRITDGASSSLDGTSVNGAGVAQSGSGVIDVGAGAQSRIAGTSKNGEAVAPGIQVTGEGQSSVVEHAWPVEPVPQPVSPTSPASSQDSGGGSSGSGAAVAAIAGVASVGGAFIYFRDGLEDAAWQLETAQPLTVESGDAEYWADAVLDSIEVDAASEHASVRVSTRDGAAALQLAFRDGADGVKHFAHEDAATQTRAALSVNTQTREFFYVESGVKAGEPYTVKSHGWLKSGSAQADTSQGTTVAS